MFIFFTELFAAVLLSIATAIIEILYWNFIFNKYFSSVANFSLNCLHET